MRTTLMLPLPTIALLAFMPTPTAAAVADPCYGGLPDLVCDLQTKGPCYVAGQLIQGGCPVLPASTGTCGFTSPVERPQVCVTTDPVSACVSFDPLRIAPYCVLL